MASNPANKRVPHKTSPVPGRPGRIRGRPRVVPGNPSRVRSGPVRDMTTRYMRGGSGITWTGLEDIVENFEEIGTQLEQARRKAVETLAQRMLAYATFNAPWTDDSTRARVGLNVETIHDEGAHTSAVILRHGVDYGIYLETMQGGRFAIIIPTVQKFAGEMAATVIEVV